MEQLTAKVIIEAMTGRSFDQSKKTRLKPEEVLRQFPGLSAVDFSSITTENYNIVVNTLSEIISDENCRHALQ